jgi:hypothetical protein
MRRVQAPIRECDPLGINPKALDSMLAAPMAVAWRQRR